jgi:hypothetical protein
MNSALSPVQGSPILADRNMSLAKRKWICRHAGAANHAKGRMRTLFDLVLGTLLIVAKACFHGLISAVGLAALCGIIVMAGFYAWRR